ncbi:universal stress protein [Telluria beijingensis]|uniref:universal stress protein n=1 Tax=Telluria beijingensis TaxID=3068633 RepID=UPI002795FA05|nr:universal stress protein [Massilia sp. REN29]
MNYRSMLVHADLSRHATERHRLAARLASAHDAHLIAVAATGVSRAVFPHGYQAAAGSLEESYFEPLRDSATQALDRFDAIALQTGVAHETRLVWDLASDALARMARFVDLAVVSQYDPDEALTEPGWRIPEYVAITSACPVLVLPCAGATDTGRHILVAWDGSRESSAALKAALPMMRRAARVSIVSFRSPDDGDILDARCQTDLAAFLARHEACADILALDRHIDHGQALLAMTQEEAVDLIVMGCYGHSQFRELFLGGVTRTVLRETSVPVLMAR